MVGRPSRKDRSAIWYRKSCAKSQRANWTWNIRAMVCAIKRRTRSSQARSDRAKPGNSSAFLMTYARHGATPERYVCREIGLTEAERFMQEEVHSSPFTG